MTGWQPIETVPKDAVEVLVACPAETFDHGVVWFYHVAMEVNGEWSNGDVLVVPTHWMPIPPPPTA